ncbi:MAG: lipid-A-disaccharide synthase N-terminal domain-containing protein [Alphaproteobacteria bacterium]|nr:lipid-A-disaccharide synthase N-terminal domain-containing protein [Alphaproteobacteria bacterium]
MDWSVFQDPWVIVGFCGQALFGARFLVQWIVSERLKRSVIPLPFWFLSLGGGAILLSYAISQGDPVFIAGQGLGLFIYMRNLYLIYRGKSRQEEV